MLCLFGILKSVKDIQTLESIEQTSAQIWAGIYTFSYILIFQHFGIGIILLPISPFVYGIRLSSSQVEWSDVYYVKKIYNPSTISFVLCNYGSVLLYCGLYSLHLSNILSCIIALVTCLTVTHHLHTFS